MLFRALQLNITLSLYTIFIYRKGIAMSEHPIVLEYLRAYNSVLDFKQKLSQVLMDKGEQADIHTHTNLYI